MKKREIENKMAGRQTDREISINTERQRDRQTDIRKGRETNRQRDKRQQGSETDTERQTLSSLVILK
jgi:hypothetical protein